MRSTGASMLSHAVLIPMPRQKHRKHRRRCDNQVLAPYSFLAKHSMPGRRWAQSKRRWLMERKQRTRFWQRDNSAHAYGERIGELDLQLKATSRHDRAMSALPLKPDIDGRGYNVRFVPKADIAA